MHHETQPPKPIDTSVLCNAIDSPTSFEYIPAAADNDENIPPALDPNHRHRSSHRSQSGSAKNSGGSHNTWSSRSSKEAEATIKSNTHPLSERSDSGCSKNQAWSRASSREAIKSKSKLLNERSRSSSSRNGGSHGSSKEAEATIKSNSQPLSARSRSNSSRNSESQSSSKGAETTIKSNSQPLSQRSRSNSSRNGGSQSSRKEAEETIKSNSHPTSDRFKSSSYKHASGRSSRVTKEEANTFPPNTQISLEIETKSHHTDSPPQPFERTTSKRSSQSAVNTSKYDSQTEEIIQTIMCSTTSNQSTTMSSASDTANSTKSNLLDDLRRGINLLDALVESEKLNKAEKKRLVKKIVKGLLKAKFCISSSSSLASSTRVDTSRTPKREAILSKRSYSKNVSSPEQQQPSSKPTTTRGDRSMQYLKPMTRSEVDYEKRKRSRATKESVKLDWIQQEIQQLLSLQKCLIKQRRPEANSSNPVYANATRSTDEYYYSVGKFRDSSTSTYASTKDSHADIQSNPVKARDKPMHDESSDSPVIVDKFVRHRTKLRTPEDASDTLGSYARTKQKDFLKQYQSSQERLARDLIYARPYGGPYIEPVNRTKPSTAAVATSASSSTFLSSGSISLPDMPSSTYPEKPLVLQSSVAIQTSDSLRRNNPSRTRIRPSEASAPQPSISYSISFRPQSDSARPVATSATMQDHLRRRKPSFVAKADARRECIVEMNRLRQQRNEQRHKLFVLLDDPDALRTNLQLLQPVPMAQRRCFSTRQLKAATRQRYDRLPEIRAREEALKQQRIRTGQRMMRDMFSRDLQRRALRGSVDLSNSMTVTNVQ